MNNRVVTQETDNKSRNELLSFLSKIPLLTNEEVKALAENIPVRFFKKGTVLVNEGDICNKCYFVLKGCLRQYIFINGVDKSTQFYTEEQAAVFFSSIANQSKSESHLSCVEDSILIVGEPNSETEMYKKFPKLEQITRMMMAQDFGKIQDALSYFIASSPEERYLNLLKTKPDLLQRVPQHQLASYIGVSPESLSRIRKRLLKAR
ncbi:MAG: Crp/Fnr family transcriptional regulator [Anditalea sp.]